MILSICKSKKVFIIISRMQTEPQFQKLVQSLKKPLSIEEFKNLALRFTVIDTRVFAQKTGLVKGSYWLPGQSLLCSWLPTLLDPSVSYLIVCQRDQLDQILERFILMGFMKCMGYNNFDMKHYDGDLEYPVTRKWDQLGDVQKKQFLDVRSPYEWNKTGVVKGAMLIQLKALDRQSEQKLTLLKEISRKKLILINCRQGQRARIASSILYRHNIPPIVLVQNVEDFPQLGVKLISVKQNQDYWKKKLQKGLDWSEGDDQNKAERQLQTDNINRMQVEECYQQCLRNHPGKSIEECQRQCVERKRRNHKKRQETVQMQHAENKNQFQASKMRITPSKLSEQESHFKALNEQEIESEGQQSKFSRVLRCISEHNYSAASDELTALIAKNPENSNFYINRAMCHMKLGQVKQAEYDLNEAIQKDHLNFIPYFDLASLKLSSSSTKENLFTALQNLYCSLSCMYLKRGLESKSTEDFQKAIEFSPTNLQAFAFFSLTKLEKGDLTGCLNILQKMDKLTESKNTFIQQMIKNIRKRMEIQQKSDNPESSKNLTESNPSEETESLIIEHFGSSQFGKRLVGKSITFENDKSLNEEIQRRVQEWNKLYSSILKQGSSELRVIDQMEPETTGMQQSMNQNRVVWIME